MSLRQPARPSPYPGAPLPAASRRCHWRPARQERSAGARQCPELVEVQPDLWLQQVKARYYSGNLSRHALSIEPA
jgi:hypothetical protein